MCVLCYAAKKRHIRRAEVLEAMRSNSSGFFMAALRPNGTRDTIRTLDKDEAIKFFDDKVKEEDAFAMHARIPSRGGLSLANVHGWEEDGILMGHNMTITAIDDMMRRVDWKNTDSEFFFRRIFMPYFRGFGKDAYKDGKLHPDIVNFVEHFVNGTNKFMFIMPDNRVLRFGNWVNEPDRKENGEIAFWASNTTYRVYQASWPSAHVSGFGTKGGSPQSGGGFCHQADPDIDEGYWEWEGCVGYANKPERSATSSPTSAGLVGNDAARKSDEIYTGALLRHTAGDSEVLRLALADMVCRNLVEARRIYAEAAPYEQEAMRYADRELVPKAFDEKTYEAAVDGLEWALCADEDSMEMFIESYATELEQALCAIGNGGTVPYFPNERLLKRGLDLTVEQLGRFCRLMNLDLDYGCGKPEDFATAYVMTRTRKGNRTMAKIEVPDLIGNAEMTVEDSLSAVEIILGYIDCEETADEVAELQKGIDAANEAAGTPVRREGDAA